LLLAQDGVDAGGEAGALDGDLPVAFDEVDDDVLAAQSGQQAGGGDGGLGVAAADGLPEDARVGQRCLGEADLVDGERGFAGRGEGGSGDELQ
jgi:hypothetical protein